MIAAIVAALLVVLVVLTGCAFAISVLYHEARDVRTTLATAHAAEIAALHDFYRTALQQVGNTVQFGTPTPEKAEIDFEPTPEMQLGRAIQEDTIARGIEALRQEYDAAGIRITDEELRAEVVAIATGAPIPEAASIKGLVH